MRSPLLYAVHSADSASACVIELENRLFDNQRCCAKASDDAQFKAIPIAMREELDRRQILFLPDIFDLISEYA